MREHILTAKANGVLAGCPLPNDEHHPALRTLRRKGVARSSDYAMQ